MFNFASKLIYFFTRQSFLMFLEKQPPEVFYKKSVLKKSLFLIKLQAEVWNFIKKETLAQVLFSCKFCEMFKSIFFTDQLQVIPSISLKISRITQCFSRAYVILVCGYILRVTLARPRLQRKELFMVVLTCTIFQR